MENTFAFKTDWILRIYFKLRQGETFTKKEFVQHFIYTNHLADTVQQTLNHCEILTVCKILLESRSMRKDEMLPLLDKRFKDIR